MASRSPGCLSFLWSFLSGPHVSEVSRPGGVEWGGTPVRGLLGLWMETSGYLIEKVLIRMSPEKTR